MSYPNSIKQFVIKIDKNASGWSVGPEYFNVPATTPFYLYLDHIPKDSATTVISASGGAAWTEVSAEPVGASQYLVDYDYGKVTFSSSNAGAAVQAVYKALGDDIMAEHVNTLQDEVVLIEETIGTGILAGNSTLDERLVNLELDLEAQINASGINGNRIIDNTVRAGALKSDIKGIGWGTVSSPTLMSIYDHENQTSDVHAASAISAVAPVGTSISSAQGHINSAGGATVNDENPHGLSWFDIYETAGELGIPSMSIEVDSINCSTLASSGIFLQNEDYGHISPAASGIGGVGSQDNTFASGCFNDVYGTMYHVNSRSGSSGQFTTNDGKTVKVENGLVVSIL